MKRMIIITALAAAFTGTARAQAVAINDNFPPGNDYSYTHATARHSGNQFTATTMVFSDGKVTFSGLPHVPGITWAVITNGYGRFVRQMKISPDKNVKAVGGLNSKKLYFLTIVYRDESKKAFVLNP